MERVDVAIVGGGPAGAAAAEQAAGRGAEAVVVEKGVPRADREGLGPDSTDAAGMLDYWVDIMGIPYDEIPEEIVLRELDRAEFLGPSEGCVLRDTGIDASYPGFGFTFHRARMDDWLRERAEGAGAEYRVGTGVKRVEADRAGEPRHALELADGSTLGAEYLVLADGPQRTVTLPTLDQFLDGRSASDVLGPRRANHVAYQEYRRFPEEVFEDDAIKFWWGYIPGETAYPWVFPNDGNVARVGLTMPMGMNLADFEDPEEFVLLSGDDSEIPAGGVFIRRLLEREYGDRYDIESDFPLVEDRGKRGGVEAYSISSTRPIDSPAEAGVAVVGGAMGTTSAFHEGGYHVAVRSGRIAGRLAAADRLGAYNDEWKEAIGDEILRNVAIADVVREYRPDDWDRTFRVVSDALEKQGGRPIEWRKVTTGLRAARFVTRYKRSKFRYRNGRYVQLQESEYAL